MKSFKILGKNIEFDDNTCKYFDVYREYEKELIAIGRVQDANLQEEIIESFGDKKKSYKGQEYFNEVEEIGLKYIEPGKEYVIKQLCKNNIFDVSKKDFDDSEWRNYFAELRRELRAVDRNEQKMRDYREKRKNSRGRWVGGGFGISGSIKGAMQAQALNMAEGAVHTLINGIGNFGTSVSSSIQKDNILDKYSYKTFSLIPEYRMLVDSLMDVLVERNIVKRPKFIKNHSIDDIDDIYEDDVREKQDNMLKNIVYVDSEKKKDLLVESLKLDPTNEEIYIKILQIYPNDIDEISNIMNFLAIDVESVKLDVIYGWIMDSDIKYTNTLEEYFEAKKFLLDKIKKVKWIIGEFDELLYNVIDSEEIKFRTILDINTDYKEGNLSKSHLTDGNKIVLETIEKAKNAAEAKKSLETLYYEVDINKIEDLINFKIKVQDIYKKYKVGEHILNEINSRLVVADKKRRTIGGCEYATIEEASEVQRKMNYVQERIKESKKETISKEIDILRSLQEYKNINQGIKEIIESAENEVVEIYEAYIKRKKEYLGLKGSIAYILCAMGVTWGGKFLCSRFGIIVDVIAVAVVILMWIGILDTIYTEYTSKRDETYCDNDFSQMEVKNNKIVYK